MNDEFLRESFRDVGYNVSKLSRTLGLDYTDMKRRFGADEAPPRRPAGPRPANIRELAKPGYERFVIAVKAASSAEWPDEYAQAIYRAKKLYDAGTHTMCQNTRQDGWVVLYSVPLRRPRAPKPFFFMPVEAF